LEKFCNVIIVMFFGYTIMDVTEMTS